MLFKCHNVSAGHRSRLNSPFNKTYSGLIVISSYLSLIYLLHGPLTALPMRGRQTVWPLTLRYSNTFEVAWQCAQRWIGFLTTLDIRGNGDKNHSLLLYIDLNGKMASLEANNMMKQRFNEKRPNEWPSVTSRRLKSCMPHLGMFLRLVLFIWSTQIALEVSCNIINPQRRVWGRNAGRNKQSTATGVS